MMLAEQDANAQKFPQRLRELVGASLEVAVDWIRGEAEGLGYPITPDPDRPRELCGVNWIDHAIYVNPHRDPGADVLWDLLHELGHADSGPVAEGLCEAEVAAWEEAAWKRGWSMAGAKWPELEPCAGDFWAHAHVCLTSYAGYDGQVLARQFASQ